MKLSTLSIWLGLAVCALQAYGLLNPAGFTAAARKFPRSLTAGWILMLGGTAWFLVNVNAEAISDFAAIKKYMLLGFAAVGLATCVFVRDFLAVRGLAVLLLLLAKTMVDSARWTETDWRLVVTVWAYLMVAVAIWLTIAPWRMRDLIEWGTASPQRLKRLCLARMAFGALLVLLGLTAFRAAEARVNLSATPATANLIVLGR